ncbi:hypothetical protein [Streptomyces sp. NRRL B-24720]|uniref:hypothetical protein n=1 Tax=Streptomyces sp. NRRL B-24720 TaxID=1476876 RepID=UPI00068D4556
MNLLTHPAPHRLRAPPIHCGLCGGAWRLEGGDSGNTSPKTLGLHRVTFAVDDIDDVLAHWRVHGVELLSKVAQYEDSHRLCYVRTVGPG